MGIIIWLVVGGIVGWLASIIMKTNAQMGIIANVLVGIVGSWLGFWIAGMLGLGDATRAAFEPPFLLRRSLACRCRYWPFTSSGLT